MTGFLQPTIRKGIEVQSQREPGGSDHLSAISFGVMFVQASLKAVALTCGGMLPAEIFFSPCMKKPNDSKNEEPSPEKIITGIKRPFTFQ